MPTWWEHNRNKLLLSTVLGLPIAALYLAREPIALAHLGEEYVSFILLLAGLYVIAGGIRLTGDLEATPLTNTGFLAIGSALASFVGTTGASMLLIRPLLQTNRERTRVTHTVVSNVGGLLVAVLLLLYFIWDSVVHAREPLAALRRDRTQQQPLRLAGVVNALWLLGVVGAVALLHAPWREGVIVGLAALSLWLTPRSIRRANGFTSYPMVEVAVLFAGSSSR